MLFYRADCFNTIKSYGLGSCVYRKIFIPIVYNINIYYIEFELIKETPCGYWIKEIKRDYFTPMYRGEKIWVSKDGKNRIAYPTKEEALFNFYKRRERYIRILKSRLNESEQVLKKVESKLKEMKVEYKNIVERIYE